MASCSPGEKPVKMCAVLESGCASARDTRYEAELATQAADAANTLRRVIIPCLPDPFGAQSGFYRRMYHMRDERAWSPAYIFLTGSLLSRIARILTTDGGLGEVACAI